MIFSSVPRLKTENAEEALTQAAKRFFTKALSSPHNQIPRVITLDKNPAYPPAIEELIKEKSLPNETLIRQTKYLNNIVEQDHRFIKKITKPMLGFKTFLTAEQTCARCSRYSLNRNVQ